MIVIDSYLFVAVFSFGFFLFGGILLLAFVRPDSFRRIMDSGRSMLTPWTKKPGATGIMVLMLVLAWIFCACAVLLGIYGILQA